MILFYSGDQFSFTFGVDPFDGRWARLQYCHDHHFLFIVKRERKQSDEGHNYDRISASLQLIGTDSAEAKTFSYRYK